MQYFPLHFMQTNEEPQNYNMKSDVYCGPRTYSNRCSIIVFFVKLGFSVTITQSQWKHIECNALMANLV